jgi:hypothetical protein
MSESNLLFQEVGYTLQTLLNQIDLGSIGLPELQRPFVWKNAKVRELFDSMYRGYPVGYLLLWQNATADGVKTIGVGAHQKVPNLLIVDGQQRLTSLYAVLKGRKVLREDYSEEHIEIAFNPLTEEFKVADAAVRRDKRWIPNISILWAPGANIVKLVQGFVSEAQAGSALSPEEVDRISDNILRVQALQSYPFRALELLATATEEQVSQVFVRINSEGKKLNEADFILTLMSVHWDEGRHQLEQFARSAKIHSDGPSAYNRYIQPSPDQMLRAVVGLGFKRARLEFVYSLLRGKDLETKVYSDERRDAQFARLREAQSHALNLQVWKDFLKCLGQAGYANAKVITSQTTVLYAYVLFLIGHVELKVPPAELRRAIARWFFFSSLTGRYTNSPESALEADLLYLREARTPDDLLAFINRNIAAVLTDDFWSVALPNQLNNTAARSPALMAYVAALCKLDAKVLLSDLKVSTLLDPTTDAYRNSLERHHLFPKDWLKHNGFPEDYQTNQIANYALVEWPDNAKISKQAPSEYWPTFADRYGSAEWETIRYWHALPENWETMPYEAFLAERRKRMAQVVRDGFGKV